MSADGGHPVCTLAAPAARRRAFAAGLLLAAGLLVLLPAGPAQAQTAPAPAIQFLPEEEALFRDFLAREPAPPLALAAPPAVGAMIPLEVPLQVFPGPVMTLVPATRGLRYLRTPAGIAAVDPDTRRVSQILAIAPRP